MRKYLISTLLLLFAFGCASSSKNETAKQNSPENEDPIASGKMDMAYDSDLPQTPSRQTPPAAEAPKATADQLRQALQSGNSREVEAVASKLLAVNPKDTKALNALAIVQLKANKPSMARFILKKVLEIDPLNSTALNNMGVAYAIGNEENKSFTELKKAHEADSKNIAAASNLGAIQAKYRNFSEARRVLEPVYSNGKSSVAFANNYALSLKATGDFKAARRVYEAALEKDSRNVSVLLNYAILLVENLGDKTKGQEAINRLKLLGTDTAIMEKAKQLEAKLK